jgi:hypothetical protein
MSVDVGGMCEVVVENSKARCKLLFEDDGKRRSTFNVRTDGPGPCCFSLDPCLFWPILEGGGQHRRDFFGRWEAHHGIGWGWSECLPGVLAHNGDRLRLEHYCPDEHNAWRWAGIYDLTTTEELAYARCLEGNSEEHHGLRRKRERRGIVKQSRNRIFGIFVATQE